MEVRFYTYINLHMQTYRCVYVNISQTSQFWHLLLTPIEELSDVQTGP